MVLPLIRIVTNIGQVLKSTENYERQLKFAVAKALTDTARDIQRAMPSEAASAFEGGIVGFTRQAFYIEPARKDRLVATVGVKDKQAEYLSYQVYGGRRPPKRTALRLPAAIELDPQGNLPAGTIKRLIAAAKSGRRIRGKTAKRLNLAKGAEIVYGKPKGSRNLPVGLYARVSAGGHNRLVPLVVFPKQDASYEARRFDFYGIANRISSKTFDRNFERAWALALKTAR